MMSDKLNIEELFNSRLGDAELTPSPGTWKGIERKLRWKQFLRFRPGQLNIFYLGGLLISGAALVTIISTGTPEKGADSEQSGSVFAYSETESSQEMAEDPPRKEEEKDAELTGESLQRKQDSENERIPDAPQTDPETEVQGSPSEGDEISPEAEPNLIPESNLPAQQTVVSYFTSSVQSGCAPLSVNFYNQSINEISAYWNFGNSEKVTERNPVHRFNEPGRYTVMLTCENAEGQVFTHHQVVEVFPTPRADFEIEEGLDGIDGLEALSFMNYSAGAFSYSWNLVEKSEVCSDNWSSNEFQPSVSVSDVEQEARYIRLLATNEFGCTDTSIQALPFSTGMQPPELQYPTAFSPNPSGPGGGIYSPHEVRNDLFHPVFDVVPEEYILEVYSRHGELVFRTSDVYQGWDGYYHQERASGGVYLWVAEGIWDNGDEFKLRGDVTLLWVE